MKTVEALINQREGLVSNDVFSAEIHALELDRIFGRSWLFVGHESLLAVNHDYFASIMGDAGVIVQRDGHGRIRVYLNKCRHRGAEVCLFDSGNARTFTCSYHGWSYTDGALITMPFIREAYGEGFDRSALGLIEVPHVTSFGGLIFATWDPEPMALEAYLGDAKWWLENFLLQEDMGGLELIPGPQKYLMPTNWKLLAENFAGDGYHFVTTHASVARLQAQAQGDNRVEAGPDRTKLEVGSLSLSVAANCGTGVPHGFVEVRVGPDYYAHDLRQAEGLGREAVTWLEERRRRSEERLQRFQVKPYSFHAANIFPNLALIGVSSAFYGKGLILHHPTAFNETEVWMWCAIEKSAPAAVKERQQFVLAHRQSAAGMVAPDDHENFQRITDNLRSYRAHHDNFFYGMAIDRVDADPRPLALRAGEPWPGRVLPLYSEVEQRDFYRYWSELIDER